MKIIVTANESIDNGMWKGICELLGINEWAVNEGQMDSAYEITLTEEQLNSIGYYVVRGE